MKELITQAQFSKEYEGKNVSVVCTRSPHISSWWDCKFSQTSLLNIAHFVVELFNCATLSGATHLTLEFGNYRTGVDKCTENNTFTHYLDVIASKLEF